MGSVLYFSLLLVGLAQLLSGTARIVVLLTGLAGLFVPQLALGFGGARFPRHVWIYFLLLPSLGAVQSIATGDVWPLVSAAGLAAALLLFLSVAPRIVAGTTAGLALSIAAMFLLSTTYALFDSAYIEAVRSSAPPLALAALVLAGMTQQRRTLLMLGSLLFVLLVLVWNSRAEALAVFVYLCAHVFLGARGGVRKTVTLGLSIGVLALLVLSDYWSSALKLDDTHRGVGSGLTGRITSFHYSMELISERPIVGVGYRRQELYFEDAGFWVGNVEYPISSSHNGVLGMLIEWGIVGSLMLLAPVLARWRTLWRRMRASNAVPAAVSFLVFIMFERYYINFGNLYTIMFLAMVISWLRPLHQVRDSGDGRQLVPTA